MNSGGRLGGMTGRHDCRLAGKRALYLFVRIRGRACDEQEGNGNAKDDNNDALRRMWVRASVGGGGCREAVRAERGHRCWCNGSMGLRNRDAKWYGSEWAHRDGGFGPTVDRLAIVPVLLFRTAVGRRKCRGWGIERAWISLEGGVQD